MNRFLLLFVLSIFTIGCGQPQEPAENPDKNLQPADTDPDNPAYQEPPLVDDRPPKPDVPDFPVENIEYQELKGEELIERLAHSDSEDAAIDELIRRGEAVETELTAALEHEHPAVRARACFILGQWEGAAEKHLPALEKLSTDDPYEEVRGAATFAIAAIGEKS